MLTSGVATFHDHGSWDHSKNMFSERVFANLEVRHQQGIPLRVLALDPVFRLVGLVGVVRVLFLLLELVLKFVEETAPSHDLRY